MARCFASAAARVGVAALALTPCASSLGERDAAQALRRQPAAPSQRAEQAPEAAPAPNGDDSATGPGPRTRVAGFDSLLVRSRVHFAAPEMHDHLLDVAFSFPARARVALRVEGGRPHERVLRYAFGDALFGIGPKDDVSQRREGADRVDELLALEARRAAFVWPEAHTWHGEGRERRAVLAGLGTLVAELEPVVVATPRGRGVTPEGAPDLRPRCIRALRVDGSELETLTILTWARHEDRDGARAWPATLELSVGGAVHWREEVLRVARAHWTEDWFVPPDRRRPRDSAVAKLRATDLPQAVVREVELPRVDGRPPTLEQAIAFAEVAAEEERGRGRELDPRVTLTLTASCEPRAVRLALAEEDAAAPEGWHVEPARPAWIALLDGLPDVQPKMVEALARAAPAPEPDRKAALWLAVAGVGPGSVQLVLSDVPR